MFFKLHSEGKIGYKQLTEADLGRTQGNTTHIGLFGDILTFLPDKDVEDEAMFLYNNKSDRLGFSFDRIGRKNGDFNSPKIKKGGKNVVSVVTVVRDTTNKNIDNRRWFLIWFGLESEEVVFYLMHNESEDYKELSEVIDLSNNMVKGRTEKWDLQWPQLIRYLEKYVNRNNVEYIKELETTSQVGSQGRRPRPFDLEKANNLFKQTGRQGEELIAKYLDLLLTKKQIFNYSWFNSITESGLPYDFTIQMNSQNIIYVDVKSTLYKFEQPLIFSNQELEFITQTPNYNIFRVYNLMDEATPTLRICENSNDFASTINPQISTFRANVESLDVALQSVKISVLPIIEKFTFQLEINL